MTDEELKREVGRVFAMLQAAEVEAAQGGQACMSGAFAAGRNMVVYLSNRLFPETEAPPEKPDGPP